MSRALRLTLCGRRFEYPSSDVNVFVDGPCVLRVAPLQVFGRPAEFHVFEFRLADDRCDDRHNLDVGHLEAPSRVFLEVTKQFAARQRREGVTV